MKRILITSTQYPYYGGAATNAYALIKYFRSIGVRTCGVFFENKNINVDPDSIGGVFRSSKSNNSDLKKNITKYLRGNPQIILCKNYAAPIFSRKIYPGGKIVYLASGCPQMMELSAKNISAQKYLISQKNIVFKDEVSAIKASDFIIPNSKIGFSLLEKHYGKTANILEPFNTSFEINNSPKNINFDRRGYDIGFICSNFNRSVKNANLAFKIFDYFADYKKIAIGNNSSRFKKIDNTVVFSGKSNEFVINTLSQTKLILCTSFYDASPNIIREAIACGCNILVSKNCGWHEVYSKESVCSDVYNKIEWLDKARALIRKNINYNVEYNKINFSEYLEKNLL